MHPGWYPDPFAPYGVRWWDGTQWTAWTAPGAAAFASAANPEDDVAAEEAIARWARIGLAVGAVISIAALLASAVLSHRMLRDLVHQIRVASNNADNPGTIPRLHVDVRGVLFFDGLGLVQLGLQVLLMIWLYRAATFARRAGIPARRDPVWAWAGFLVPVVNFWFPYQVAADTTPGDSPARRLARRWWICWLAQAVVSVVLSVVSYFSVTAALGCACVGAVLAVASAVYGRAMITEVGAVHRQIAARSG